MSKVTVAKFGGTSVADAEAMRRCAAIVTQTANTRVVVLSASSGVTNLLVDLARGTLSAAEQEIHLKKLKTIQDNILSELGNPSLLRETMDGILKEIADMARQATQNSDAALEDRLVAQGELMSTRLFTEMMNQLGHKAVWFDVRKIMRTDSRFGRATPAIEAIHNLAQQDMAPLL